MDKNTLYKVFFFGKARIELLLMKENLWNSEQANIIYFYLL